MRSCACISNTTGKAQCATWTVQFEYEWINNQVCSRWQHVLNTSFKLALLRAAIKYHAIFLFKCKKPLRSDLQVLVVSLHFVTTTPCYTFITSVHQYCIDCRVFGIHWQKQYVAPSLSEKMLALARPKNACDKPGQAFHMYRLGPTRMVPALT